MRLSPPLLAVAATSCLFASGPLVLAAPSQITFTPSEATGWQNLAWVPGTSHDNLLAPAYLAQTFGGSSFGFLVGGSDGSVHVLAEVDLDGELLMTVHGTDFRAFDFPENAVPEIHVLEGELAGPATAITRGYAISAPNGEAVFAEPFFGESPTLGFPASLDLSWTSDTTSDVVYARWNFSTMAPAWAVRLAPTAGPVWTGVEDPTGGAVLVLPDYVSGPSPQMSIVRLDATGALLYERKLTVPTGNQFGIPTMGDDGALTLPVVINNGLPYSALFRIEADGTIGWAKVYEAPGDFPLFVFRVTDLLLNVTSPSGPAILRVDEADGEVLQATRFELPNPFNFLSFERVSPAGQTPVLFAVETGTPVWYGVTTDENGVVQDTFSLAEMPNSAIQDNLFTSGDGLQLALAESAGADVTVWISDSGPDPKPRGDCGFYTSIDLQAAPLAISTSDFTDYTWTAASSGLAVSTETPEKTEVTPLPALTILGYTETASCYPFAPIPPVLDIEILTGTTVQLSWYGRDGFSYELFSTQDNVNKTSVDTFTGTDTTIFWTEELSNLPDRLLFHVEESQ